MIIFWDVFSLVLQTPCRVLFKHKSNEGKFQWLIDDLETLTHSMWVPPKRFGSGTLKKKSQIKVIVCARHIVNGSLVVVQTFCQNGDFGLSNDQIPLKPTWHLLNINLTKSIKEEEKRWFACGRCEHSIFSKYKVTNYLQIFYSAMTHESWFG